MIINIALWADAGAVRRLRAATAAPYWNPFINTFIKPFGQRDRRAAGLADLRDARRR